MSRNFSSFFGGVSFVGQKKNNTACATIRIASQGIVVAWEDPGLKHIRLTKRDEQAFIVVEANASAGVDRIIAFYSRINIRQARALQDLIDQGELTDLYLLDELPAYLAW